LFCPAEIVELEDEVFGEIGDVSPDYPADAGGYETVFVAWMVGELVFLMLGGRVAYLMR
jgi:hypothetical protein